jgi:hypothetical protein
MAAPFLEFDLNRELEQLHGEPEWNSGQNAKTLVKYDDLRVVLTALKARSRLPQHQTKGRVSIQTVVGHILVRAEGSDVRSAHRDPAHIGSEPAS